jgi:arabinofuranosyltransferase
VGRWWFRRPALGIVLVLWVPVAVFAVLAWHHRWMSDDGYINLRVVHNVLYGNGPVFNAGERVEAATSPMWIVVLVVARIPLWFLEGPWVAVLLGIVLSSTGVALSVLGARRWWASLGRDAGVPLGVFVVVALPPMWDFASSGLETGLAFFWIGACWWITARRLDGDPMPAHRPWWAPAMIGLGPLVRPDLALLTLAFAIAYGATSGGSRRGACRTLCLGLALPVTYQIFRMGYYGLLVPNTALAKEANRSLWHRGHIYLDAYLDFTLIWLPLLLLAFVLGIAMSSARPSRTHLTVAVMPIIGGLLHAVYIVRVGGDFMHARLLLPATFAVLCPAAAVPRPPRKLVWAPIAAICCWAVASAGYLRFDPGRLGDATILVVGDERVDYVGWSGHPNPVTVSDFREHPVVAYANGLPRPNQLVELGTTRTEVADQPVVASGAIGLVSLLLPTTYIADQLSLADPIGAHLLSEELPRRAGHDKPVPWEWHVARLAVGYVRSPEIDAARDALGCGELAEVVESVSDPLTPARFLENLFGAVSRTQLRIPSDPIEAREQLC